MDAAVEKIHGRGNADDSFFQQLLAHQREKTPAVVAVSFNEKSLTYHQLGEAADALAGIILARLPQSRIVGISSTRNIEMIIGLLAILKAGKAYLPLDPQLPVERLHYMISESGMEGCVAVTAEIPFFQSLGIKAIASDGKNPVTEAPVSINNNGLAYVLFTSGSTGRPKAVCMGYGPVANLLRWQHKTFTGGAGIKTLQFSHLGFDVSFQEIFSTLTTGGTLVLVDDDLRLDPAALLRFIQRERINRIILPYVALQYMVEAADTEELFPDCLQEVITGGEKLKITPQIVRFFSSVPRATLYNQYGPTEAHIVVTQLVLKGDPAGWPALPGIGQSIDNCRILILGEDDKEAAPGNAGELCIAGSCLAFGYLDPSLTAQQFVHWKDPSGDVLRIYKTGDLARRLADGHIEFLGRRDEQVKIRGNRVEPAEIEWALSQQAGVGQAVVIADEGPDGQNRLIAYLAASDHKRDTASLRTILENQLPDYMIPSVFVWMETLPRTASGKVDKRALPRPAGSRPELSVLYRAPGTTTEKKIAGIWSALLQLERVGVDDNFFELGGNSLLAVKSVTLLRQRYDFHLPVTRLYQHPSVAGIAAFLEGRHEKTVPAPLRRDTNGDGHSGIAVIGMAGRFPGANTLDELWNLLCEGKEAIRFFSKEELDPNIPDREKNDPDYVAARGILDQPEQWDAAFFGISNKLAALMDPQHRVFLEIAWEALEASGVMNSSSGGRIGVFGGTGNNSYFLNNVLTHPQMVESAGLFQVTTYNEKDYVASRTAYTLNLKGPAVSLYSACSTSLLAIAKATESIRLGECEMALAGAAAITSPVKSGHVYQEGAMFSRDGHCRPFDADAQGTMFSDGAAVVLLKDLELAKRDGNTIYAVIRGVGVSNDGGGKGSFTAPSAEGQAAAISMAIRDAGIDPSSISYVEAHGTATPIGDPIEIEGLNIAFGAQERKQYCAIGSIKSNMGHLTAAAGAAGLIKTVLALKHKQLPPSIHFINANPNIDFANSPFYVNAALREWTADGDKRLAGVSSFGVGGTNVHVILEEYDQEKQGSSAGRPLELICWSAKTETSRDAYAKVLGQYLAAGNDVSLADLAYNLHTGRQAFKARRFTVSANLAELSQQLEWNSINPNVSSLLEESAGPVIFLFPGQGAQYPGMGRELYQYEPVFREAVDECAALLQKDLDKDIRQVIYAASTNGGADGQINNTFYTQPAIFVIEYALARLWMSWGIEPVAFIGHSIGEFVAAHLAGVFSLRDALHLIASRGRMMSSLPEGKMLAVRSAYEEMLPLLPEDVSLAAVNSPGSAVVAGPSGSIAALAEKLTEKGISNRVLQTSHAFHSSMMDPVVVPFEEEVKKIERSQPRLAIISTVTGTWLTDAEATDPAYWSGHLRSTVRFADAITTMLAENKKYVLLETGPGSVLTNLVRQRVIEKPLTVLPSLDTTGGPSAYSSLLKTLGQLWLKGVSVNWYSFYAGQKRKKLILPGYQFDRKRFWLDPPLTKQAGTTSTVTHVAMADEPPGYEVIPQPASQPTAYMRKETLIRKIKELLEDTSGIEMQNISAATSFLEIGLDSLLLTQVSLSLKREFGLPISFRQLSEEYSTLDALATYLDAQLPAEQIQPQEMESKNTALPAVSGTSEGSAIDLIARQIQLLSQQVALLQGGKGLISPAAGIPGPQQAAVSRTEESALTPEEQAELKKPFGATARIEKQARVLTATQQAFVDALVKRYNQKTRGSKAYTQQYRAQMADPRVVSGFRPLTKEIVYSIVVRQSKGCRLWDIDGNEYIDVLNGFGSNMLGYQPEVITTALHEQINRGYELGPQHELAGPVAELICSFTGFDRAALCNTGSEAVLGAMRIARTVTGRSLIVAFSGSYHGINDEVIVRGTKKLKTFPAASGIMPEGLRNMLILEYGTEQSLEIIRSRAHELAAVLVEPVQGRRADFQPVDFLKQLRQITEASQTALIFDEVITGFRVHPGGVQALFGIKADIATYGKVVAAGLPIGVIAGRKQFMDALDGGFWQYGDASVPEAGVTYFAGTFVRHPLALAAAKASLEYMKWKGPSLQEGLNAMTRRLVDALNLFCRKQGLPLYVVSFGSLWILKTRYEIPYHELLFVLLRERGIHIQDGFPCFLTAAFTDKEVDFIIETFEQCVLELVNAGFYNLEKTEPSLHGIHKTGLEPPVPGARLGRDQVGNPAWFVVNPGQPGKYMKLKL
ncbi:MAG TPA: amino acid adenylation domain-containing protein [Puia sp.]|nr:amino acid adenylation domain-containing protein [Puia sp.]